MRLSCLIDTNVLIGYLGKYPAPGMVTEIEQAFADGATVSVITTIELLGWQRHTEQSRNAAKALLGGLREVSLTRPIVDRVIELRSTLSIKLPDAIIAATAQVEGLALMTCNTADFVRVPGLNLINPGKNKQRPETGGAQT